MVTLSVVLLQAKVVLEEPITLAAVVVCVEAVGNKALAVWKMDVALATEVVCGTLDVVLSESVPRLKVLVTVIADVVTGRV